MQCKVDCMLHGRDIMYFNRVSILKNGVNSSFELPEGSGSLNFGLVIQLKRLYSRYLRILKKLNILILWDKNSSPARFPGKNDLLGLIKSIF